MSTEPVNTPATSPATTPTPAPAPAEKSGMSTSMFVMLLVWPLVVAGGLGFWLDKRADARVQDVLGNRPDVAVVDDIALIKLAIDQGADRYNPASVLEGIGKIVHKNGLENTVLLSQSMVMYAPQPMRIHVAATKATSPEREIK